MAQSRPKTHAYRELTAKLAARQSGRVARRQLVKLGVYDELIRRWVRAGYLIRRLPGVYAVGHAAGSIASDLTEALLYAGPDAMLSHATGAWWLGLIDRRPSVIHITTPRRCASRRGIAVHDRRPLQRVWHRGLPVAPAAQVLLGLAAAGPYAELRHALANAEYHGYLVVDLLQPLMKQSRPGSAALRRALRDHQPQLARTRTELERALLTLCESHALPIPEFNVIVEGFKVDALWRDQRVVVEVDGRAGHSTWARIRTDRRRDLVLRRARYIPLRYVWEQITDGAAETAEDIRATLTG